MKMALSSHLSAYPFPTLAALLANAVTISAWANSAYCFCLNRPPRQMCNAVSSLAANLSKAGHRRIHLKKKTHHVTAWDGKFRLNSLVSETRGVQECNDIVSAVRNSLLCDLVKSHHYQMPRHGVGGGEDESTLVLVLAVSGGCDSMALLHSILSLTTICEHQSDDGSVVTGKVCNVNSRRWLQLGKEDAHLESNSCRVPCELHVAHFNHEQRGENSDGDCDFVRDRCIEHQLPFYLYSWSDEEKPSAEILESTRCYRGDSPKKVSHDSKRFTQDVARRWRQRKLKELLSNLVLTPDAIPDSRWGAILTAHHRDDADETIMLKLLRGSHLTNLRSMNERSDAFNLHLGYESSSVGYFAKPMLNVRKRHIIEYLTSNSLEWREDDSNSSSKYRRNLVRNELIPLLSEIAGGENALQKRLTNLEKQSREISQFFSERSIEYIRSMPSDTNIFTLLRDSNNVQFNLVHEQALHLWIMNSTRGRLQVSYDQMLRIRDQIHNYPDNLRWKMDIGRHWEIQRNGDTLVVVEWNGNDQPSHSGIRPWIIIAGPGTGTGTGMDDFESEEIPDVQETVELSFGPLPSIGNSPIDIVQVKDCAGMKFKPSWRKGRSAMKLKDFLRGQMVPLHRRDSSFVLCLSDKFSRHVLAVHVEALAEDGTGTWNVSADFFPRDDMPVTKVVLGKTLNRSTHTSCNT